MSTNENNYNEEELLSLYRRFQFNIDQLLTVRAYIEDLENPGKYTCYCSDEFIGEHCEEVKIKTCDKNETIFAYIYSIILIFL